MANNPSDANAPPPPPVEDGEPIAWHQAIALLRPHVVHIATPNGSGTGWLFHRSTGTSLCAIATAAHVVQDALDWELPIKVSDADFQKTIMLRAADRAIIIGDHDTATILLSQGDLALPATPATLQQKDFLTKVGVEIGWLGFPGIPGAGLSFFSGRVSSYIDAEGAYFVDGVAINGVSGGPAFRLGFQEPILMGIVSAYVPNRATGVALPGVAVIRNIEHVHDVAGRMRSVEEAQQKQQQQQEASPPAPAPPTTQPLAAAPAAAPIDPNAATSRPR